MLAVFPVYAWHDGTAGFLTDDAMYLLLADFFSPYYEGNYLLHRLVIDQARFPPAFPVLIGLLGGGSENMPAAHLVTCATFIASGAALYAWAARVLDSRQLAAACLLIYALLPKTLVYVIEIWSEFLYTGLVFLALIALDVARRDPRRSHQALLACAVVIGLAMLTRTIGVALLAAFIVYLYLHAVNRKYRYVLIAVLPPACWKLIKVIGGHAGTYGEDLVRYMSVDGFLTLILTDIPHNASLLLDSWGRHFAMEPGASWYLQAAALALLALALIGATKRAADKQADFYYIVFYIVIVLVWPYPDHATRFLYPVLVPTLAYLFIGLGVITPQRPKQLRRQSPTALLLLTLALIYPNALSVAERFLAPVPEHLSEDFRHTRQWLHGNKLPRIYDEADRRQTVIALIKRVDEHTAPHECVYAVHPPSTMLYSDRRSIILPDDASIEKLRRCRYLFVMNLVGEFGPLYPLDVIDTARLRLLDRELDHRGRAQAYLFEILQ